LKTFLGELSSNSIRVVESDEFALFPIDISSKVALYINLEIFAIKSQNSVVEN